jgi:transposase
MVKPATLIRQYKQYSSDFATWDQKAHAQYWLVFPENMGPNLAIDEVSLSNGELWTFLTNKAGKGRKGTLVAAIRGTRTTDIEQVLLKIPLELRLNVKEVSMDMAKNIESAIRAVFTQAKIVTDRFHVVQLIQRSLQDVRISLWRRELDRESKLIEQARASGIAYRPEELVNGDTPKQLLARCRFALMKYESQITDKNQWLRLRVAFHRYPELERAFNHAQRLRSIFNHKSRVLAEQELDDWIRLTRKHGHESFVSAANSIRWHKETILNFFDNRATNASAESFNARIKLFRANQKGVRDTTFFLFRLSKLYA